MSASHATRASWWSAFLQQYAYPAEPGPARLPLVHVSSTIHSIVWSSLRQIVFDAHKGELFFGFYEWRGGTNQYRFNYWFPAIVNIMQTTLNNIQKVSSSVAKCRHRTTKPHFFFVYLFCKKNKQKKTTDEWEEKESLRMLRCLKFLALTQSK